MSAEVISTSPTIRMFQPTNLTKPFSCVKKKKNAKKQSVTQCFALHEASEQMCCGMRVCREVRLGPIWP